MKPGDAGLAMGENAPAAGEKAPPPGLNGDDAVKPGVETNGVEIGVPGPWSGLRHSLSRPLITCWISDASYSIAFASFRASSTKSITPVPNGASCPSIMFSETPVSGSPSANIAASIKISTVSSNEQRTNGPESSRLIP